MPEHAEGAFGALNARMVPYIRASFYPLKETNN
jgi:hypothetical protein